MPFANNGSFRIFTTYSAQILVIFHSSRNIDYFEISRLYFITQGMYPKSQVAHLRDETSDLPKPPRAAA